MATSVDAAENFYLCRSFNAHSTLSGYRDEDTRRDSLIEHITFNNLALTNIHNVGATFQNEDSEGRIVALG